MADSKMLNEQTIGDLILCEPITRRGIEALEGIGLTTKDITPSFFYNNLRVASKYDKDKEYKNKAPVQTSDQNLLYYQYTVDHIQFKMIKEKSKIFNSRFRSNSPNEYPLLMLGVAGNGKSIEINRLIRQTKSEDFEFECGSVYFDLEESFEEITYGTTYTCPHNTPLWLFCIKLLDGIMRYIQDCHSLCSLILHNFKNNIEKKNLANDEQKQLFKNIGNYRLGDNIKETLVFDSLISLLTSKQADKDIRTLLKILMWIMYCTDTNKKQYIVLDNIEQYIMLNNSNIQIPNSDLAVLYKTINSVVMNVTNEFNRIEKNLGWKAFKIILVLRRTSIGLLDSTFLHSPVKAKQNITEVTGHFQLSDIWAKKKKYIWDQRLKKTFSNSQNGIIIDIVDRIMRDGDQAIGMDYQSIIAPLMSYGIRRNARSQAHAAYSTYEVLTNGKRDNINLDVFNQILSVENQHNSATRYMFRRALIEFQFKWSISNGDTNRWEKLGIGHLTGWKSQSYAGRKLAIEGVAYYNTKYVTLMRRILTYLSCFPDKSNTPINGQGKSVEDMFSTISLFNLIKGVLRNPKGKNEISDNDFLQFARVIMALSDMSNEDTKSAPYVILGIKDDNFHVNTDELTLAKLLKTIWNEGPEESKPGQKYNCSNYGARITDAGHSFLLDWQASFSFMASLHCFTVPPLFFLKDILLIKYVIETVYNASLELCKMYEEEAESFCGNALTLKTSTYLPKHNDTYVTFKQRIKELHMDHLILYREFIEKNYSYLAMSEDDMINLTQRDNGFISKYIDKYNSWKTTKGAPECF